jgi:hypothetical protein
MKKKKSANLGKPIKIWHLVESMDFLKELRKSDVEAFLKLWKNFKKAEMPNIGLGGDSFRKLQGDIWYFREYHEGVWYRTLCFWDKTEEKNTLVVCTHTIMKKKNKVPPNEIDKAKKIRSEYFESKAG